MAYANGTDLQNECNVATQRDGYFGVIIQTERMFNDDDMLLE